MRVPNVLRVGLLALLMVVLAPGCGWARGGPKTPQVQTISLAELGFQAVPPRLLLGGDAMYTLNYVDDGHLLVTWTTRGLIKRRDDSEANDEDRNVAAVLLEAPSGKVLARTEWHLRDHRQYLWALGHGHFMLRIRNELLVISPMEHLAAGKAFEEQVFLSLRREIAHISVSPMGDLLTLETEPLAIQVGIKGSPAAAGATQTVTPVTEPSKPQVQINFYRLRETGEKLELEAAGVVLARDLVELPVNAEGFLDVSLESAGVYLFDFQEHGGKRLELSPYDTSCIPRARFVSASEFIAFGCTTGVDKQQMAGFNLKGEENWIAAFPNRHVFPYVIAAPAAGRFALSRTVVSGLYLDLDHLTPEQVAGQEVTVLQSYDGRQLLKVTATPFQRAGGNFDLSPDGLGFAVVHGDKVDLYRLPALTKQDVGEIKASAGYAPARNEARIDMGAGAAKKKAAASAAAVSAKATPDAEGTRVGAETVTAGDRVDEAAAGGVGAGQAAGDRAGSQAGAAAGVSTASGDVPADAPRARPSLYDKDHPKKPE